MGNSNSIITDFEYEQYILNHNLNDIKKYAYMSRESSRFINLALFVKKNDVAEMLFDSGSVVDVRTVDLALSNNLLILVRRICETRKLNTAYLITLCRYDKIELVKYLVEELKINVCAVEEIFSNEIKNYLIEHGSYYKFKSSRIINIKSLCNICNKEQEQFICYEDGSAEYCKECHNKKFMSD